MESLALIVSILFLIVLLCGPISLLLSYLGFKILSLLFAILAIFAGIFWISVVPIPMSLIGILDLVCALIVIRSFLKI